MHIIFPHLAYITFYSKDALFKDTCVGMCDLSCGGETSHRWLLTSFEAGKPHKAWPRSGKLWMISLLCGELPCKETPMKVL